MRPVRRREDTQILPALTNCCHRRTPGGFEWGTLGSALLKAYAMWWLLLVSVTMAKTGGVSAAEPDDDDDVVAVMLQEAALNESSGLAASRRRERCFWSHNDSGGGPHLYAFDASGRRTGQVKLKSVSSVDWEDMASFTDDGVARLLVADCGDNLASRTSITLYLFDEPDPYESSETDEIQAMTVVYPHGPRDCEAVSVDQRRGQILLISKTGLPISRVYSVPLPDRNAGVAPMTVTAKSVGTLPLPMVTAMDVDQSSGDIWLTSYFQGFRFRAHRRTESIARQLARLPQPQRLPRWRQIEAVAIDAESGVWVTTEGSPARLGRLPALVEPRTDPKRD